MKRLFSQLHRPLRNERGEITFFACFFVVGVETVCETIGTLP